jgi:hypothetical protein
VLSPQSSGERQAAASAESYLPAMIIRRHITHPVEIASPQADIWGLLFIKSLDQQEFTFDVFVGF